MDVKPGYRLTEIGVVPESWVATSVAQLISDGVIDKPLDGNHGNIHPKSRDFVDTGIPFVMANNVQSGSVDLVNCSFIRKEQADKLQKGFARPGDVLLTHKATIGHTAIVDEIPFPYIMLTPQVTYYRVLDKERLSNVYLRYFFDGFGFQTVLRALSGGGTRAYIGISAQHRLPVVLPPHMHEQRAIATALSDVDALLVALERLIAKKRDLKQAAMQQLLTGQTRLPGFTGEWERTTLGELTTFLSGGTPSRGNEAFWSGEIPWISATSLRCFEIWRSDSNVSKAAVEAGSKMAPVGASLLLVRGSALHKEILCGLVKKPVCFNQDVKALVPHANVVPRFLTWFIKGMAEEFLKLVSSAGNTAGVLDTKLLKAFEINLPTIAEQTAIASVLSDMDAELSALEQRIAKTQALKQGMMQELLTGRTRLF